MKDCFGRDIKSGDQVAYATRAGSSTFLSVGQVQGYCKNGKDAVRVRVLQSNCYAFEFGNKNWSTGEVKRAPREPYVTTVTRPATIVIINGADIPGR